MKKNVLNLTLLAAAIMATGSMVSACSGGDDDDDDDGGSQPVISQADGGAADFTTCTAVGATGADISIKVRVGEQGFDTSVPTADLPASVGATVSMYNPATNTTSGTGALTNASGETNVTVDASSLVAIKMSKPPAGATSYVDTYNYALETPAASSTNGAAVFNMRIIPVAVQNGIAAIIGVPTSSLTGTMQFAGSVIDCAGEPIIGATLQYNGAEPPRCSGSATLPCVSYSTDTGEDYSDASGQVFMLGMGGSGSHTVQVMGILTEGGAPVQIGEITMDGIASSIALGAIPAQNAP